MICDASKYRLLCAGDQQSVRRAKPPRNEVRSLYRSTVRVLEVSHDPPRIRVEELSPPRKELTPAQEARRSAKVFRPIAIEIGWITFQWNRLHEALRDLFAHAVHFERHTIPFAIWHSTPNDRAQREMLRAAIVAAAKSGYIPQELFEDIEWVLQQLDPLAGRRNDAIHAPLTFVHSIPSESGETRIEIAPTDYDGNPRALALSGKPILSEFKWYRDHLMRLAAFCEDLHSVMMHASEGHPWPERPQLPPRGQFVNRAALRRKNKSK